MENKEQMMHVADKCLEYELNKEIFESFMGSLNSKSCSKCKHFKFNTCEDNLFDSTLTSLD